MKILIATDAWAPQVNGVVRTLQTTAIEARKLGHTVEFLTPAEFRTLPCPTYPEIRLSLFPYRGVARRIESFAPDCIHVATEGPIGLAVRRYCLRHALAYTTSFHTNFPEYVQARTGLPLAISDRWMRWFHRPARAVMAATPSLAASLAARGYERIVRWSRGVDLERFSPRGASGATRPAGAAAAESIELAPRPAFLCVGRVAIEKNLEAFLALDLPGSKWIVGDGPARATLAARYPDAHFVGMQPEDRLPDFYRAADVFVFPSRTDTFGLVLLEAMACGTPVAAYPVQGPIDVVGAGGVLDEDLRRAALGALEVPRARARAEAERYGWSHATQQFLANLAAAPGEPTHALESPTAR